MLASTIIISICLICITIAVCVMNNNDNNASFLQKALPIVTSISTIIIMVMVNNKMIKISGGETLLIFIALIIFIVHYNALHDNNSRASRLSILQVFFNSMISSAVLYKSTCF